MAEMNSRNDQHPNPLRSPRDLGDLSG